MESGGQERGGPETGNHRRCERKSQRRGGDGLEFFLKKKKKHQGEALKAPAEQGVYAEEKKRESDRERVFGGNRIERRKYSSDVKKGSENYLIDSGKRDGGSDEITIQLRGGGGSKPSVRN